MSDFDKYTTGDLRLILLRSLNEQTDHTLNEVILQKAAETWGHRRSRDVIRAELRWLQDVGAVSVKEVGGYLIASVTHRGQDHVERRAFIDGVNTPGPEG